MFSFSLLLKLILSSLPLSISCSFLIPVLPPPSPFSLIHLTESNISTSHLDTDSITPDQVSNGSKRKLGMTSPLSTSKKPCLSSDVHQDQTTETTQIPQAQTQTQTQTETTTTTETTSSETLSIESQQQQTKVKSTNDHITVYWSTHHPQTSKKHFM